VADGTGYNWGSPFSKTQIQNALDLAAVYVNSTKKQAYVYVAGGSVDRALTMRNGVSLYGSVTTLTTAAGNDDASVADYEQTVIDERPGIAGSYTSRTVIEGLAMEGDNASGLKMIVDGFEITNGETVTAPLVNIDADQNTILRNSIVHGVEASNVNVVNVNNGLLYNTLIHGNSVEDDGASLMLGSGGKAVNVTVAVKEAVKDATPTNWGAWTAAGKVVNSICYNEASDASVADPFAPYFDETGLSYSAMLYGYSNKSLRYQLMEKSAEIDGGDKTKGEVAGLIDYETDRDLLGNP
jgi:small nuclear ribonucleoprotein (snRNP)-like protein